MEIFVGILIGLLAVTFCKLLWGGRPSKGLPLAGDVDEISNIDQKVEQAALDALIRQSNERYGRGPRTPSDNSKK